MTVTFNNFSYKGYWAPGQIVTTSLVANYDAGNTSSYVGTGTTWTDLSSNPKNLTLRNSPTYSSSYGGYLDFSPTNSYANTSTVSADFAFGTRGYTLEVWAAPPTIGSFRGLLDFNSNNFDLQLNSNGIMAFYCAAGTSDPLYTTGFGTVTAGNWYHFVVSHPDFSSTVNLYLNGVLKLTSTDLGNYSSSDTISTTQSINGFNPWGGKIAIIRIYKQKGLTQAEVTQNFNALRGRFAL